MKLIKIVSAIFFCISLNLNTEAQNKVYFWGIPLGIQQDEFVEKLFQKGCTYDSEEKCFRGTYLNDTVCIYVNATSKSHKIYSVIVYYSQYYSTIDTIPEFIKRMAQVNDEYMEILGDYIYRDAFMMGYFLKKGDRMVPFSEQMHKFKTRKNKLTKDFGAPIDASKTYNGKEFVVGYRWENDKTNRLVGLAIIRYLLDSQTDIEYTAIRLDIIDKYYLNMNDYENDQ